MAHTFLYLPKKISLSLSLWLTHFSTYQKKMTLSLSLAHTFLYLPKKSLSLSTNLSRLEALIEILPNAPTKFFGRFFYT